MNLLALRVLSLDAPALTLAGLQHLVLRVADDEERSDGGDPCGNNDGMLDVVACSLPALQTLYVEAGAFCFIEGGAQLLRCRRLEALALVNVRVEPEVAAPAGCRVAAAVPVDALDSLRARAGVGSLGGCLNALALRGFHGGFKKTLERLRHSVLDIMARGLERARLPALRELRIVLDADSLPGGCQDRLVALDLGPARLPALRVLEVDVPCTLRLRLARALELRTLVLVVHAVAGFAWEPSVPAAHPWAAIFVRTAAAPPGAVRSALRAVFRRSFRSGAAAFGEAEGGAWQCAAPAGFRPGDLRACACRACLDCLGRAGVPLAAPRAWRREGFGRLLAPLCWCARPVRQTGCAGRGVLPKGFLLY